ncbi:lysozyme inhibitor LprI family protein [Aurantiacibacter hainanensis]|uniref:lysozyme inhibitor LprI family protein n=1 Tax=Aurantiacibacter hainanensis TaxID=3076114 RepID=UPI0030C67E04
MSLAYPLLLLLAQAGATPDAPASAPPAPECAEPMTQQDMNYCAAREWEAADALLNRQWRKTAEAMQARDIAARPDDGRPGYYSQLLRGQRAWLVYRDRHCASVGYNARGGSLEPLLVADCKTALTRDRTRQLHELADWPR